MDRSSNTGVIEMAAPHEGKEKGNVAWKGNLVVIYFGSAKIFTRLSRVATARLGKFPLGWVGPRVLMFISIGFSFNVWPVMNDAIAFNLKIGRE